ncbi:PIN domain-like protein [Gaertneriomyces semiglobifer]|nr:PIN domain-like protein [Gaertneriomyces semiglobifer]
MGIQGLLPFLKEIHRHSHISKFAGKTLVVDTYVWLHRGVFTCALELATGQATTKYVDYCMRQVRLLTAHDVRPILVFDGGSLSMKSGTETQRRKRREDSLRKAHSCLQNGQKTKANEYFQQCVNVTPHMAYELIKVLKAEGIEYIVAPYEADAQLAYLVKEGLADAAITEDSDLLVFGCPKVLTKLDKEGNLVEIRIDDFGRVPGLESWTLRRFRQMCILSGCDYLESPHGIGLKKAFTFLKHKYAEDVFPSWRWGRASKAPKLPDGYIRRFRLAELTFLHQLVYDPREKKLVHLTPLPETLRIEMCQCADLARAFGSDLAPEIAEGIATGVLHPDSKQPFENDHTALNGSADDDHPIQLRVHAASDGGAAIDGKENRFCETEPTDTCGLMSPAHHRNDSGIFLSQDHQVTPVTHSGILHARRAPVAKLDMKTESTVLNVKAESKALNEISNLASPSVSPFFKNLSSLSLGTNQTGRIYPEKVTDAPNVPKRPSQDSSTKISLKPTHSLSAERSLMTGAKSSPRTPAFAKFFFQSTKTTTCKDAGDQCPSKRKRADMEGPTQSDTPGSGSTGSRESINPPTSEDKTTGRALRTQIFAGGVVAKGIGERTTTQTTLTFKQHILQFRREGDVKRRLGMGRLRRTFL